MRLERRDAEAAYPARTIGATLERICVEVRERADIAVGWQVGISYPLA
jgi:hypothetical protein